jgi:hypothetical protein
MSRLAVWLHVALLLAAPGPVGAQPNPVPKDGRVTIPLDLSPAAAPKPASKYYLYPEYRDLQPGDKLSGFLKCFMEQDTFFNKENTDKRQKWLETPLTDLPADVREQAGIKDGIAYDPPYARLMTFMDQAARYNRVEWNEWFNLRHDGVYLLIAELQKLRALADVLRLRLRGEVKNREFDRAVVTVKSMMGLADFCRTNPTLIGGLVGTAIAQVVVNGVEEMIQQPGCPNLYWSLSDLPAPLVPLRNGLGGERMFLSAQFTGLMTADRPLTDLELDKHLKQVEAIVRLESGASTLGPSGVFDALKEQVLQNPRLRYTAWSLDANRVKAARGRLVEYGGFKPSAVETFSPLQVVVTDDLVQFEVLRDELMKWFNLPYPEFRGADEVEKTIPARRGDLVLGPVLLPAVSNVKRAEARLDQRVAFLRVVEAVRLFARENGGKLPTSLADIKLPLPADPVSGKPFDYAVKDGVATLSGTNASPGRAETNRVYEIRLRK